MSQYSDDTYVTRNVYETVPNPNEGKVNTKYGFVDVGLLPIVKRQSAIDRYMNVLWFTVALLVVTVVFLILYQVKCITNNAYKPLVVPIY